MVQLWHFTRSIICLNTMMFFWGFFKPCQLQYFGKWHFEYQNFFQKVLLLLHATCENGPLVAHGYLVMVQLWNVGFFFCDYYCPNLQNDCHLCHIVKYMIHIEQTKLNHTKILYYLTSFGELKEYIELLQARERERERESYKNFISLFN